MPPKRKQRGAPKEAAIAENATDGTLEEASKLSITEPAEEAPSPELWTDEQETCLFTGMIRWKPVGSFLDEVGNLGASILTSGSALLTPC